MHIVPTSFTIADYCQSMERREVVVNREYQRSEKIWPSAAQSYLIETIMLGFPMPKLSLYQVTDLKSKKTYKEIVDGQQRSIAIRDFFKDELRLAARLETEEIAGRTYSELEPEFQQKFLDYQLTVDLFVAATPEEVREVFRRMNSYTIPLNAEEHRHAIFQGPFKWFIHRLGRRFDESFVGMGLFSQRELVRMADTKLLSEICHALQYGIQTTNKKKLDDLYSKHETSFSEEDVLADRLTQSFDYLIQWQALHHGPLMKPHIIYSLVLAITHSLTPVDALQGTHESPHLETFETAVVLANITALGAALEDPDGAPSSAEFVAACRDRTNVKEQRVRRFIWLCRGLLPINA